MSGSGRKKHEIWINFTEIKSDKRKGTRAVCKICNKEIEGQVLRIKKHMEKCYVPDNSCLDDLKDPSSENLQVPDSPVNDRKRKRESSTLDSFVIKSSSSQRTSFDEQVARFLYATNSSFSHVEHPEFVKLIESLRPGYSPPSRKRIGGDLLDSIYSKEREKCSDILSNEIVTLGLDGWSNIHNEPIICVTLTTKNGDAFLTGTYDTSGNSHTGENLYDIAKSSIRRCKLDFKCSIGSVVTDNTTNVKKMRELLEADKEFNVVTYGCSAHILNLLANDIEYPNVKEQILQVVKYFRNNHFANACYRAEKSPKLTLPSEVRWNSFTDSLENYLKAWAVLVKICDENKDKIDSKIQSIISNVSIKRNAEHYFQQLKPISVALDKTQRENCTIGETAEIFKQLKKSLEDLSLGKDVLKKVDKRYKMAITPTHLLAYCLDPKFKSPDLELTADEKKEVLEYARQRFPDNNLVTLMIKFSAKSSPFQEYLFESDFVTEVSAMEWWKSQKDEINKFNASVFREIEQILTAKASTANVERIFSSFGLVQSKLRNRLGMDKAAKLVFLFKRLNCQQSNV